MNVRTVAGVAGLAAALGLAWACWRLWPEDDTAARDRIADLPDRWAQASAGPWREAPSRPGLLPHAADAAKPWRGSDSLLGILLISAARNDPSGLPPDRWFDVLTVVDNDLPDDVLVVVASELVALREGRPVAITPATGPWQAWRNLEIARLSPDQGLEPAVVELLRHWPGHPRACEVGVRWGLARGRLAFAERTGAACGWSGAALGRLRGDLLDRIGRPEAARDAWILSGAVLHALAVACQEGVGIDARTRELAAAQPGPAGPRQVAWCALADGAPIAQRALRTKLAVANEADPPSRILVGALALAEGEPGAALASVEGLDDGLSEALRGTAHARLGDPIQARAAFERAHQQQPHHLAVLEAWWRALPEDVPHIAHELRQMSPVLAWAAAGEVDRNVSWHLALGLPSAGVDDLLDGLQVDLGADWVAAWTGALQGPGCGSASPPEGADLQWRAWCSRGPDPALSGELAPAVAGDPTGGVAVAAAWLGKLNGEANPGDRLDGPIDAHPTLHGLQRLRYAWAVGTGR